MSRDRGNDATRDALRLTAAAKLGGYGQELTPGQRQEVVELLSELYEVGMGHGITPEDWAAVAGLAIESVDAIRWRDRHHPARRTARELTDARSPGLLGQIGSQEGHGR